MQAHFSVPYKKRINSIKFWKFLSNNVLTKLINDVASILYILKKTFERRSKVKTTFCNFWNGSHAIPMQRGMFFYQNYHTIEIYVVYFDQCLECAK